LPNVLCGCVVVDVPVPVDWLPIAPSAALGGDASWAAPYWAPLSNFAGVCAANLPFPAYTHTTDDFAGAIANYTNLALKCIGALGGWGYMHQAAGNASGAAHWYAAATGFATQFVQYGLEPTPTPHIKQAFNSTFHGNGTWNLLYNGLWVRLLGLEGLFPPAYPFETMMDDRQRAAACRPPLKRRGRGVLRYPHETSCLRRRA
jgi:hypothetical protein